MPLRLHVLFKDDTCLAGAKNANKTKIKNIQLRVAKGNKFSLK
jgi:hypothetical protein